MGTSPSEIGKPKSEIVVTEDKFTGKRTIKTPFRLSQQGFTDDFPVKLSLQADLTQVIRSTAQLLVKASGTDWGFYKSAIGEDRTNFKLVPIDSGTSTAAGMVTTEEYFVLEMPISKLQKASGQDYEIKIYGKRNSGTFVLPSSLSRSFLAKLRGSV